MMNEFGTVQWRPSEERFRDAVSRVEGRRWYGRRVEPCSLSKHYVLFWSNAKWKWDVCRKRYSKMKCREGSVELDANEILVEARSEREAREMAMRLPILPLAYYSIEAKDKDVYDAEGHIRTLLETDLGRYEMNEKRVASGMYKKGYRYILLVKGKDALYAKTTTLVGSLLRDELKHEEVEVKRIEDFLASSMRGALEGIFGMPARSLRKG